MLPTGTECSSSASFSHHFTHLLMTKTIKAIDSFVLRTPIFSFESLSKFYELAEGKHNPFTPEEMLLIEEAIYLASPDLYTEWQRWRNNELTDIHKIRKLQISLLKYFKRMCTRCTPFGLFAGCTTGKKADETLISLQKNREFSRHTRLDMNFTCALAQKLSKHQLIKKHIKYYPNTSIYELGDQLRYVDYHYAGKRRVHRISSIAQNFYIDAILRKAEKSGLYFDDMMACLVDDEVDPELAEGFVNELLSTQLLISDLEPSVTGTELIDQILNVFDAISERLETQAEKQELAGIYDRLRSVQNTVKQLDQQMGNPVNLYKELQEKVESVGIGYEKSKLLQTDLFTHHQSCSLAHTSYSQIKSAVELLNRLTPRNEPHTLKRFAERFTERYETKEMPLLEVLDVETGVGYIEGKDGDSSDIIKQVPIAARTPEPTVNWTNLQSFFLKKLTQAMKEDAFEIKLQEKDFNKGEPNWEQTSETLACMVKHFGYEDGSPQLYLASAGGTSAANLLGRFAHGAPEILQLVKQITDREQNNQSDAVLAEIVHLPESRTGNILMRPVFRTYEIPYLAKPSVSKEHTIDVSDLMVSVHMGNIHLRSKRLNKRVIPHLSNAHNYKMNALPVYHFLCDMQHHNRQTGFFLPLGQLQNEFNFLPRISYNGIILSLASWRLAKKDYQVLLDSKPEDLLNIAKKWKDDYKMPEHIVLADGDNELFVDLNNLWSLKVFKQTIKKRPSIQLKEFGYQTNSAVVKNQNGESFTNQMVLVFEKDGPVNNASAPKGTLQLPNTSAQVQRDFDLGSEWLFYKLYCGPKTADQLIRDFIGPIAGKFVKNGWIDRWFFMRYSDPHKHLRLRFHFNNLKYLGNVITSFNEALQPWLRSQHVWALRSDTYKREVERYTPEAIVYAEHLFHIESECIADFLQLIAPYGDEETRWLFSLKMINQLLSDFGLGIDKKIEVMDVVKNGFAREFGANKSTRKGLATKYRTHRKKVEAFLNGEVNGTPYHAQVYELLERKSRKARPYIHKVQEVIATPQVTKSQNDLLYSYIHMLMNRTFRSHQRMHEMVLYDLLYTNYKSMAAREKKMGKKVRASV